MLLEKEDVPLGASPQRERERQKERSLSLLPDQAAYLPHLAGLYSSSIGSKYVWTLKCLNVIGMPNPSGISNAGFLRSFIHSYQVVPGDLSDFK